MRISVFPDGRLMAEGVGEFRCALGRSGISADKREGDGATPVGVFLLRRVFYRPDRLQAPVTGLPIWALSPSDGWCDESNHPDYNRQVRLPFAASHERMWRDDHLYDLGAVLGHNDEPVVAGQGSAIFLHVARPDYAPTEGCVALALDDLMTVLKLAAPGDALDIQAG